MKKSKILMLIMLLLYELGAYGQSFLQDSKNYIYPFDKTNDAVLLGHIENIADSVRIIGLGEVSHYTKECYELKHQIIKKLIAKGYHALILEVDFGQALLWNRFVTKGVGDIDKLIAESGWFTYRTEEFKHLLLDIREHNRSADKPFQVFGMEMTAMNYNLSWLSEYFLEYLDSSSELVKLLNQERKIVAFQSHNKSEVLSYWDLYYQLRDSLVAHEKKLIEKGGEEKYQIAKQITEIVRQYATYIAQDEFLFKVEIRDQFSTRNVFWCMNILGENSKIAIWAHNGHVVKKSVLFNYDILGYYLNKSMGEKYYAIGFTFNEGEFGSFSPDGFKKWQFSPVKSNSLTKEFGAYKRPYLLFDLRANLKQTIIPPSSPLRKNVPIRTDISEYFSKENNRLMNINLSHSYDCLIYIDKTNYPTTIEWTR